MNVTGARPGDADAHVVDHLARAELEAADPRTFGPSAASATASYGNGHSVIGRT